MTWTSGKSQGFLLAAAVAGDRTHTASDGQLADATRALVDTLRAELAGLPKLQRRARIAEFASRLSVESAPTRAALLPPRARALVAAIVDHPDRARWISDAPPPRTGYRVEPSLRRLLHELACARP